MTRLGYWQANQSALCLAARQPWHELLRALDLVSASKADSSSHYRISAGTSRGNATWWRWRRKSMSRYERWWHGALPFKLRSSAGCKLGLCWAEALSQDSERRHLWRQGRVPGFGARGQGRKKIKRQASCLKRLERALGETLCRRR